MMLYERTCPFPGIVRWHGWEEVARSQKSVCSDWLVCHEPFREPERTVIPKQRRIFLMGEPSSLARLDLRFLNQFGVLVSPFPVSGFRGITVESQPGLPWFYGWDRLADRWLDFAQLNQPESIGKQAELSVVVSNKSFHRGHRIRLQLVRMLQERLGERLHVFGKGIREVPDKRDAIAPYRYHLSFENSTESNYWSEKLSDAYLGFAFPIYLGCKNIQRWFDSDSMYRIRFDEDQAESDLAKSLSEVVDDLVTWIDSDRYEEHHGAILKAREKVLFDYSFYAVLHDAVQSLQPIAEERQLNQPETMFAQASPKGLGRLWREMTRVYYQWTTRKPRVVRH